MSRHVVTKLSIFYNGDLWGNLSFLVRSSWNFVSSYIKNVDTSRKFQLEITSYKKINHPKAFDNLIWNEQYTKFSHKFHESLVRYTVERLLVVITREYFRWSAIRESETKFVLKTTTLCICMYTCLYIGVNVTRLTTGRSEWHFLCKIIRRHHITIQTKMCASCESSHAQYYDVRNCIFMMS